MANRTMTVTITADTTKFRLALFRCWYMLWRIEIVRHPVIGRLRFWWAWVTRPDGYREFSLSDAKRREPTDG